MTENTWYELDGHRWRYIRQNYGPAYDRMRPYRVEVEGCRFHATASNAVAAREAAARLIRTSLQ